MIRLQKYDFPIYNGQFWLSSLISKLVNNAKISVVKQKWAIPD